MQYRKPPLTTCLHESTSKEYQSKTSQEYGANIERLVRLAYPDASEQFVQKLGVNFFVDGVHNILQTATGSNMRTLRRNKEALEYEGAKSVSQQRNIHPVTAITENQYDTSDLMISFEDLLKNIE